MIDSIKFKTIDDLMNYYVHVNEKLKEDINRADGNFYKYEKLKQSMTQENFNMYTYLIRHEYKEILFILKSETNIPSVHDLMLVNEIILTLKPINLAWHSYWSYHICEILEFYKHRDVPKPKKSLWQKAKDIVGDL